MPNRYPLRKASQHWSSRGGCYINDRFARRWTLSLYNTLVNPEFAAAALTAAATPIIVTTTNLPGNRQFSIQADATLQGVIYPEEINLAGNPLKSVASNSSTTIVAPASSKCDMENNSRLL